MSSINSIYHEEIAELLEKLEASLLLLEFSPNDDDLIEEIFRSMHTIKGSSGMFGYDKVASFVHHLESIYDLIRESKLTVTKPIINTTLLSLDHIRNIVQDVALQNAEHQQTHVHLTATILSFMGKKIEDEKVIEEVEQAIATYYISFIPNENIFENGTNPLFLLDELFELGVCEIFPNFKKIKTIEEYDPTKCTSSWDIIIVTKATENDLKDVFLFVEGDSKLQIEKLCNYDLLAIPEAKVTVQQLSKFEEGKIFNIEKFKQIAQNNISQKNNVSKEEKQPFVAAKKGNAKTKQEKNISSIRVASDKLDSLMSIVSELVTTQASLSLYAENNSTPEIEVIAENIEKLSRQLRDVAFGMTLIPIKNIMSRFQRLVRDVSNDLGKSINFKIEGDETELDKNIIESLTDPLMHILRNSLDHGIENSEIRAANNKPEKGNILFKAFYSGANVHIQIKDDGKGIDVDIIKAKAIEKGLITEETVLSNKEILDFIFHPGFSTAATVTDVSGRGVGMDVVRRNINNLRGEVDVESETGEGTTLTIKLPLTLSIIDGLLVKIGRSNYVVPLAVVEKCHEVPYIQLEDDFNRLLLLDEVQIPFLNLRTEFQIKEKTPTITQVIVVSNGERKVAITVDAIIDEYQAVLKPIGKYYKNQDYISGATILGDGTIALVLDTNKIISNFSEQTLKLELV